MKIKIHDPSRMAGVVCVVLAAVFIISTVAKLINLSETASYFLEFRFMNPLTALFLTGLLVSMELTLGIALIAERNPVKPLLICSGALIIFTIYQIALVAFPGTFTKTCPCFGASGAVADANLFPLIRNVLLLIISIVCYFFYKKKITGSELSAPL
jgi:hypothetical protein